MCFFPEKSCLIGIDIQRDFCSNGSLAVPNGDEVVAVFNKLAQMPGFSDSVVLTRDWHPVDHCSFETWPVHCVQDTVGAKFHPDLDMTNVTKIFSKGTKSDTESYSGYGADDEDTGLRTWIGENEFVKFFIVGLATDYCVLATVKDIKENWYGNKVYLISDGIRGVDPDTTKAALDEMKELGVVTITSEELLTHPEWLDPITPEMKKYFR